ncbi:hypothetical protein K8R66_03585 [bacterium]|nr:hypothetical protein [bacterium]
MPEKAKNLVKEALQTYNLSARAYFILLKVSRTISYLASPVGYSRGKNSNNIKTEHIAEALQYRKVE